MKKLFFIIFFLSLVFAFYAFSEEGLFSEVIIANPEEELFIINAGKKAGIKLDDGVIVNRDNEKVAEGYIISVRENISAAEILELEKNKQILEGDKVTIVKKAEKIEAPKEKLESPIEEPRKKPAKVVKKSKWATLGSEAGETPQSTKTLSKWQAGYAPQAYHDTTEEAEPITIDIDKDSQTVFSYAMLVLRENGYSITSSNRLTGTLLATKPLELSLLKELWTDAVASIDHKIVASFDIKKNGNYS
ncbi:MAG: hypothetical protein HQ532_01065, partial [Candidatus Omnitrophica bacterium]|nr:hypothetical protein [Candidatus Omnitrophota bacterium]